MADFSDFIKQLNSVINTSGDSDKTKTDTHVADPVKSITHQKNVKILIVTTHINQSNGYSKVVHNMIGQLAKHPWISIVHYGIHKLSNIDLGRKYPENVKAIDASALEKQKQSGLAVTELPDVIRAENPDVVFIYNEIPIICTYIEEIRKSIPNRSFKIWAYINTIYQPQPQNMLDVINRDVERIFCLSKSWKDSIKAQGVTRPVDILGHAVDSKVIRSIPRQLARQSLGLPTDSFLFVSLNKNMPRKRLDLLIMSFVKLIVRFPMKPIFMFLSSDKGERGGYKLFDIYSRELTLAGGAINMFSNRLLVSTPNGCYKDEDINIINNCADVGVSCVEAEGFGLCTFEQMACGIPQIVPEINGYKDYCTDKNSILIKPKTRGYIPQSYNILCGEAHLVDPEDVSKAMERYVFDDDLRALHGKNAKETVAAYTWEKRFATLIKRLQAIKDDDE